MYRLEPKRRKKNENADGDVDFISNLANSNQFNDYVIGISRNEWRFAMLNRVGVDNIAPSQQPDLCVDVDILTNGKAPWFEACENDSTNAADCPADTVATPFTDNPAGQNWRIALGC